MLRSIQMDMSGYESDQREQVHATLVEMYHSLVKSFEDLLVEIKVNSRMVLKHQKYLDLVKESHEIDEDKIPLHIQLCIA